MKTTQLLAAIIAATPFAKAYLTQGKTVTMSSTMLVVSVPLPSVLCYGQNAVDNNFEAVWWTLMAWTTAEVNPWLNIALG